MKTIYTSIFILSAFFSFTQPKVKDFKPDIEAKKMFNTFKLKRLASNKNICIPEVSITFITRSNWSSTKSKGPNEATSKAYFVLNGIKKETYQSIANEAHDYFVKKLQSVGYNIIPYEQFTSHKKFEDLGEEIHPKEKEFKLSGFLDVIAKITGATHGITFTAFNRPNFKDPIGTGNYMKEGKIAKSLDAAVAHLEITLEFMTYTVGKSREYLFNQTNYSVSLESTPQLFISNISLNMVGPDMYLGGINMEVDNYYAVPKDYVNNFTMTDKYEGEGYSAGFYVINADDSKYKEAALANIKAYIDKMIELIVEHKN
ncbi:MAG: hypothetical protein KatS3mg027_0843 [Bacteroidia bacterium]|nr:MAG: hypothetical protein KatS3mg027_0843 [Bacteroidia bacterium]